MTRKAFTVLFTASALMRLALIWGPPLWYDESFSLVVARLPLDRFWNAIVGDVHPPLYYLVIRPIAQLVATPWAIRLPSVIFSLLALWLAWRLFKLMDIPAWVASTTLILIGILPLQLWFAQEARMYALLEALVLAALLLGHLRKWFTYALALIAMLYTQNYGLFYVAVISLYLLVRDHRDWDDILRSGAWSILAWLPWYGVMQSQMSNISDAYWIQVTFTGPGSLLQTLQQLFFMSILPQPLLLPAIVVLFVALTVGTVTIVRERWGILLLAFGPMLLAVIASLIWQPVLLFRPLIGCTPFLYLVVCWPMKHFTGFRDNGLIRVRALYAAVFAIPLLAAGVLSTYSYAPQLKGTKLPSALQYVQEHWQDGDAIYYTDDGPMINSVAFFKDDFPQYEMPLCDRVYGNLSEQTRKAIGVPLAPVTSLSFKRLWVFAPSSPLHPSCYLSQIQPITQGKPLIQIDDNQYISSGVWLVTP